MNLHPPMLRPPKVPSAGPSKDPVEWHEILGRPTTLGDAGITGTGGAPLNGPVHLVSSGAPPLVVERGEGSAGVLPVIEIVRNGTIHAYIGLDASDQLALIAADGSTVLASLTNTGELDTILRLKSVHLEATTDTKTLKVLDASGNQVVGARGAAVPISAQTGTAGAHAAGNPPTGTEFNNLVDKYNATVTDVTNLVTALTALVARLSSAAGHGLIT